MENILSHGLSLKMEVAFWKSGSSFDQGGIDLISLGHFHLYISSLGVIILFIVKNRYSAM